MVFVVCRTEPISTRIQVSISATVIWSISLIERQPRQTSSTLPVISTNWKKANIISGLSFYTNHHFLWTGLIRDRQTFLTAQRLLMNTWGLHSQISRHTSTGENCVGVVQLVWTADSNTAATDSSSLVTLSCSLYMFSFKWWGGQRKAMYTVLYSMWSKLCPSVREFVVWQWWRKWWSKGTCNSSVKFKVQQNYS